MTLPETAQPAPQPAPLWHSFRLGDFRVTTLLSGTREMTDAHAIYGLNVEAETFERISREAGQPTDRWSNSFTPTLVETGAETVLFDTGLTPEGIVTALASAGHSPEDITLIVLTHMHGDHIGGLMQNGRPVFPNARLIAGGREWDHWAMAGNDGFERLVRPFARHITLIEDGDSPFPGATAILAPGHTPGHMAFRLTSGEARLMLTADTANHALWSVSHPDWEVRFDIDKARAIETRKRILGQIADEGMPFIGYHMPFPAVGFLERDTGGFRFRAAGDRP